MRSKGTDMDNKPIEDVIKAIAGRQLQAGTVLNNGAQAWNHTFYWHSMKPGGGWHAYGGFGQEN